MCRRVTTPSTVSSHVNIRYRPKVVVCWTEGGLTIESNISPSNRTLGHSWSPPWAHKCRPSMPPVSRALLHFQTEARSAGVRPGRESPPRLPRRRGRRRSSWSALCLDLLEIDRNETFPGILAQRSYAAGRPPLLISHHLRASMGIVGKFLRCHRTDRWPRRCGRQARRECHRSTYFSALWGDPKMQSAARQSLVEVYPGWPR
jgi:hypothetical protein